MRQHRWSTGRSINTPDYLTDLLTWHVPGRGIAIQAGGNDGTWAKYLARYFEQVWTFEPVEESFKKLSANVPDNVVAIHAGLWNEDGEGHIAVAKDPRKSQIKQGEGTRLVALDSIIGPEGVDLVYLDIEGAERMALQGAQGIIEMSRPIVVLEFHRERKEADPAIMLDLLPGYKPVDRFGLDWVYAPE